MFVDGGGGGWVGSIQTYLEIGLSKLNNKKKILTTMTILFYFFVGTRF